MRKTKFRTLGGSLRGILALEGVSMSEQEPNYEDVAWSACTEPEGPQGILMDGLLDEVQTIARNDKSTVSDP